MYIIPLHFHRVSEDDCPADQTAGRACENGLADIADSGCNESRQSRHGVSPTLPDWVSPTRDLTGAAGPINKPKTMVSLVAIAVHFTPPSLGCLRGCYSRDGCHR